MYLQNFHKFHQIIVLMCIIENLNQFKNVKLFITFILITFINLHKMLLYLGPHTAHNPIKNLKKAYEWLQELDSAVLVKENICIFLKKYLKLNLLL